MRILTQLNNHTLRDILLGTGFALLVALGTLTQSASAATATDFNAGRIIEDSVFTNSNTMSPQDIQNFLNSKVPTCDTNGTGTSEFGGGTRAQWGAAHGHPAPFTCLKDYIEGGRAAAQIIYDTAKQYAINPQVLIVLLQKEQGLVTDTWPLDTQYKTATGYGCPDTAACDSQYFGLTNQLGWSAKMFRAILNNSPTWYTPYVLGNNNIRWNPSASCGSSSVYIENRSTQALYNYTPYRPNQAALNAGYGTGDSCSSYGNRNFYLYFRDWFGYNSGPAAFKTPNSSTIYIPIEGYKLTVPYMAALQDYGISTDAIQTVSQAYADNLQTPPVDTGISSSIAHVVKSPRDDDDDGGSIYLISQGVRYQFQSMQQFAAFGFTTQDISYLPLSYIFSKTNGGILPNFIKSPTGSVFKVDTSANTKRILFEYNTYKALNPTDDIAYLSYYLADKIPSGNPITDRPVLIQPSTGYTVNLYANGNYYSIPDYNTLTCWGLDTGQVAPTYRIPQDNYIATPSITSPLPCTINDNGSNQLMNGSNRVSLPSGIAGTSVDTTLQALAEQMPLRTAPLGQYIRSPGEAAVYSVESGKKRLIPSYNAFVLLGLSGGSVDVVSQGFINSVADGTIKLGNGELVKSSDASAVYTITDNKRVLYASSDLFTAYGNDWNSIETYDASTLNASYPFSGDTISNYIVDKLRSQAYVVANNGCFSLSTSDLTRFGTSLSALVSSQGYDIDSTRGVNGTTCKPVSYFIKQADSSLVYYVENGHKQALTTYAAMTSKNNGTSPTVMVVSPNFIQAIPN